MNKCMFTGRVTADPDVRYSQGENPMCVARFNLAVDRRGKKEEGKATADFPRLVAFGKTGEFVEKYVKKGMKFDIVARVQTGSYQNKEGQTVYTTEFVIDDIEFGERKGNSDSSSGAPVQSNQTVPVDIPADNDFQGYDEEELPFN